jgi:hypothetical protein
VDGRLRRQIIALATLGENSSPVVSCYLNLGKGLANCRTAYEARAEILQKAIPEVQSKDLGQALELIEEHVDRLPTGIGNIALFARGGRRPIFEAVELTASLPTWIAAGPAPNLHHLAECGDEYDRYAILLAAPGRARVIAINVSGIAKSIWSSRPDLRRRAGQAWARQVFQDHRPERGRQYIAEQVRIVERLWERGGNPHLLLAGEPGMTQAIRAALPVRLASSLAEPTGVVAATLQFCIAREERACPSPLRLLLDQLLAQGPAVCGAEASLRALRMGIADTLVLSRAHRFELRDEAIRLAALHGCAIEVVEGNEQLERLGGVGCVLRSEEEEVEAIALPRKKTKPAARRPALLPCDSCRRAGLPHCGMPGCDGALKG